MLQTKPSTKFLRRDFVASLCSPHLLATPHALAAERAKEDHTGVAARMLKRRLKDAGLSDAFAPHSFPATGITNFLENGGTLEVAQRIAGHADSRTTKLYDRRGQRVLLEDMERIRY
jgi:site-specific recombinase XerD